MMCLIRTAPGGASWMGAADLVEGWMIDADTHALRRRAEENGLTELASALYQIEYLEPGMHSIMGGEYLILVDA